MNAPPPKSSTLGIALAVFFHPTWLKRMGDTTMRSPVATPVALATPPMNAEYAEGVGWSCRRCPFHAYSNRFMATPCDSAHTARHCTCGVPRMMRTESISPRAGFSPGPSTSSPLASLAALASRAASLRDCIFIPRRLADRTTIEWSATMPAHAARTTPMSVRTCHVHALSLSATKPSLVPTPPRPCSSPPASACAKLAPRPNSG
mmetsp:Transcript_11055/g.38390  ORF Transcript_11055/g.38390 Transcript_11055/m.38390 type:complete len:205 (-) Transcript_11055:686-1300(-)